MPKTVEICANCGKLSKSPTDSFLCSSCGSEIAVVIPYNTFLQMIKSGYARE